MTECLNFYVTVLYSVRNRMPVSLRGGGGELGNLKTLTYGFTIFHKGKLKHTI
jgi:hypothetical protein